MLVSIIHPQLAPATGALPQLSLFPQEESERPLFPTPSFEKPGPDSTSVMKKGIPVGATLGPCASGCEKGLSCLPQAS